MYQIILYLIVCYSAGSLPFGFVLGLAAGHDIRCEGSGNIGFTNVLRVCGLKWGLPVLLLDALKGFAPVFWLAPFFIDSSFEDYHIQQAIGGLMTIVGHSFPVWLKFRGGKGVATGAGVAAALVPVPLIAALASWVLTVAISRYVSLGSLIAAVVTFLTQIIVTWGECVAPENLPGTILAATITVLVWVRHRSNIRRLRDGTENKISLHRQQQASDS